MTSDAARQWTMPAPKLSIVTACLNAEHTIAATLDSVRRQTYPQVEHIVVDGASTDGTLAVVERFGDTLAQVVSEKDGGIADAMNKGWRLCTGDYVLFLHADDYLLDDQALGRVAPHLDGSADIVGFDIIWKTKTGSKQISQKFDTWVMKFRNQARHQAIWCRRDMFDRIGPFDVSLGITMDYEHFLRAARAGLTFKKVSDVFSVMRDTGISSRTDWPSLLARFAEERKVHFRFARSAPDRWLYHLFWSAYLPYRFLRYKISV